MTRAANTANSTKTAYEGSVLVRALERGGRNPHLKGHIQEVMVKDLRNARNLFNGQTTELTKSTTAKCVDLVTTRAGRVVERIQVKDVTSQSGIDKLVKQVADGKYRSARLEGSPETARLFNEAAEKAGLSKRMASTGVSTDTTTSLAQRAGATGSGSVGGALLNAAKSGGGVGAAVSGGISAVKGVVDLINGEREVGEVLVDVACDAAKGGAVGAASGVAASGAGMATAAVLATVGVEAGILATTATIAAPVVAAVAVGYLVTEAWDWLFD